ncbi:MAG: adenylosuccinate lyase [Candidatus Woesearchaeota archaeon]
MLSPLDDRYYELVKELDTIFSESNYVKERIFYEKEWLIFLLEKEIIKTLNLNDDRKKELIDRIKEIDVDYNLVKQIETNGYKNIKPTNHDVKAIELALRINLKEKIKDYPDELYAFIHFGITSEDVDNLAIASMLRKGNKILSENLELIIEKLNDFAEMYSSIVMLSRTHGQVASPTTLGKEFRNYCERLKTQKIKLENQEYFVKFSGSTGNFNSFYYAIPDLNWIELAKEFVIKFNFKFNPFSTQKEPNDWQAELFQNIIRINTILIDFSQNIWNYISIDYLMLKNKNEIGSSVMPHKINPIDFENAEGNLQTSNALFDLFSNKIVISRYQRDLSDSTVKRNYGVAYGHSLLAYKKIIFGLEKIDVDKEKISSELNEHAEILAEAVQTKLRTLGYENAYEILRQEVQGRKMNIEEFRNIIKKLNLPQNIEDDFLKLDPKDYYGIADKIARNDF